MTSGRYRAIKFMNTVIIILLILMIIGFATVLFIELFEPEEKTMRSPSKLTQEEMANRPLMKVNSVSNEEINTGLGNCAEVKPEIEMVETYLAYKAIPLDYELQVFMQEKCHEYNVGFAFALAIMESESNFNVDTEAGDSGKSIGLMQINVPNWYKYGLDAHYKCDNIEIGIRMLSDLIKKYEETDMVVMAYKGGEGFAESWRNQGKRLDACDTIVERTMYWQEAISLNK